MWFSYKTCLLDKKHFPSMMVLGNIPWDKTSRCMLATLHTGDRRRIKKMFCDCDFTREFLFIFLLYQGYMYIGFLLMKQLINLNQ